jgi:hypothetical protein
MKSVTTAPITGATADLIISSPLFQSGEYKRKKEAAKK